MKNPIVHIITSDKLDLYGILLNTNKRDAVIISIHGTSDNFYANDFIWQIADNVSLLNISMLSVNNRGSYTLEFYDYGPGAYRNSGAATEIFEKCLLDIDAWVKYALSLGYKKIILQGHSLGTEKIVYYMNKGKYRNKISAVVLLGFSDSFGTHLQYLKKTRKNIMEEARSLVVAGKKNQFLTQNWLAHAGVLPQSAESHINFFRDDSELSRAFPIRKGKDLEMYQKIKVPILGIIGDEEEYTVIPIKKAVTLLKKENKLAEIYQLKNSDHSFSNRGKVLATMISKFLEDNL